MGRKDLDGDRKKKKDKLKDHNSRDLHTTKSTRAMEKYLEQITIKKYCKDKDKDKNI